MTTEQERVECPQYHRPDDEVMPESACAVLGYVPISGCPHACTTAGWERDEELRATCAIRALATDNATLRAQLAEAKADVSVDACVTRCWECRGEMRVGDHIYGQDPEETSARRTVLLCDDCTDSPAAAAEAAQQEGCDGD